MKKLMTSLSILVLVVSTDLNAQDIHFSQFFNSPLTLNPAQSGNFDGTYRAGLNYRSQWTSVDSPYKTFSVFYDHIFNVGLMPGDYVSAGLVMYNDVAGDAKYSNLTMMLNGAYHKALTSSSNLTLGVQAGMMQKKLDPTKLKFGDMFDGTGFSGTTADPFSNANLKNLDINVGLQYATVITNTINAYAGGTVYHVTQPKEGFINVDERLKMRYSGNAGATIVLNELMTLHPSVLYMNQAKASEFIIGSDIGYLLQTEKINAILYGGLFYRHKDAIIPYIGMDYKDFKLGLSYDVNISGLSEVSNGKGGYELSLIYKGLITTTPTTIIVPCIRF